MTRTERIALRVEEWFASNERQLPWRLRTRGRRNAYFALVSEAMLQQTQASRVAERFDAFLARFANIKSLARASDDDILAAWDGLGYYRRARNLRDAARVIVDEHRGRVPSDVDALRALPGVGAYTAGAIASIAYDKRTPIVDANIERVALRVEGRDLAKGSKDAAVFSWDFAERLVRASERPGRLNEGLMELGALVCTPRNPKCQACPLSRLCVARRDGEQDRIPSASVKTSKQIVHFGVVVTVDRKGRVLLEQRPDSGLWRRMWQAPTVERDNRPVQRGEAAAWVGVASSDLQRVTAFVHATSHRLVRFVVWRGDVRRGRIAVDGRRWASAAELGSVAMGAAQRKAVGVVLERLK